MKDVYVVSIIEANEGGCVVGAADTLEAAQAFADEDETDEFEPWHASDDEWIRWPVRRATAGQQINRVPLITNPLADRLEGKQP
jgi:hypothetical protein